MSGRAAARAEQGHCPNRCSREHEPARPAGGQREPAPKYENITDSKATQEGDAARGALPSLQPNRFLKMILKSVDNYKIQERPGSLFGGVIR
jgi:hypothetical protein